MSEYSQANYSNSVVPPGAGSAGQHALDGEFGPVGELMAILLEEAFPALFVLEQKLCRSRYVHDAQYKMRR